MTARLIESTPFYLPHVRSSPHDWFVYRDHAFRSAPVSPRLSPHSSSSAASTNRTPGNVFCTTHQDHVVSAADRRVGGKMVLPPPIDDASAVMESQVANDRFRSWLASWCIRRCWCMFVTYSVAVFGG